MSYQAGEAAILTIIRTLSDFGTANSVSLANDTIGLGLTLPNSEASDRFIKLRPGEFNRNYDSVGLGTVTTIWQTVVEIAIDKGSTVAKSSEMILSEVREQVMNALDAYYQFNNADAYGQVVAGDEILESTFNNRGQYLVQELYIEWQERTTVTQND
jgi:hypothetical protein